MSDENFHEIQLSGKQLAFLFMCAVVLAGVIFMLGVSVGRDVRGGAPQQASDASPTDTVVPTEAPPQTAPNDLSYAQALQGRGTPPPAPPTTTEQPQEPAPAAPARDSKPADTKPATTKPVDTKPAATKPVDTKPLDTKPEAAKPAAATPAAPVTTAAAKPASRPPAPAATAGGFFLQVTSVRTEPAAAAVVQSLKSKGFPATVVAAPGNMPASYKVQVGPYATRADAQRASTRLKKEGLSPFFLKR